MDFSFSDLSRCFLNLCQFLALWMSLSKDLHGLIVCYMKNLLLLFTFSIPRTYFIQYLMFLHWKDGDQLPLVHLFHITYLWTFTKTLLLHQHLLTTSVSVYSVSPLWKTFHYFEPLLVFPASFLTAMLYTWKMKTGCWFQDTCIVHSYTDTNIHVFHFVLFSFLNKLNFLFQVWTGIEVIPQSYSWAGEVSPTPPLNTKYYYYFFACMHYLLFSVLEFSRSVPSVTIFSTVQLFCN